MEHSKATNLERLKHLRDHLIAMDSGSGDVSLLTWAIGEIQRLDKIARDNDNTACEAPDYAKR